MLVKDLYEIGNRLQHFRKRAGLTQAEVAEKAGISDRTYADIERGTVNMRLQTFLSVCATLHITPDEVLTKRELEPGKRQEEIMEQLNMCTVKEKEIAFRLLDTFVRSVKEE